MKALALSALAALLPSAAATGKCRALALSSGDEDAAYQAGALKGIIESGLASEEYQYDSVSGVSDGAINAVILANYTKGQEKQAVDKMQSFWKGATHTSLYKNWFGGIARGFLYEGGLYNSAPLHDYLKKEFSTGMSTERSLNIGIVNVYDGSYVDFSDKNVTSGSNLVDALFASMSVPGFFPPANVLGSSWFDGSAVWDIDIFSAINKCIDKGFDHKDIVVDVIMTSSANLKQVQAEDYRSIGMLFRYLEISSFYNAMDGLLRARFAYPGVNFRYVISPSGSIPSSLYPLVSY